MVSSRTSRTVTRSARKSCTASRCPASRQRTRRWYKGKVVTSYEANYRTLYDIAYDDGDAEQGVELSDLRLVGGGGESQSQKLLASQDV